MTTGFTTFLPLILTFCLIIASVIVAVLFIKGGFKDAKETFSHFKDTTSHFTGENSSNLGSHWLILKWFALGAVVMFGLGRFVFFPIYSLPVVLLIQAAVVYFITRKDEKNRKSKRKWYSIGVVFGLFAFVLIMLVQLGGSRNPGSILLHFVLILALVVFMTFKGRKTSVLKNDTAVRQTTGTITRHVIVNQKFLFFTYLKSHSYEYEFNANGLTFRGIDGETDGLWKKRGGDLENPVKVVYETDAPQNSWLMDIKHRSGLAILFVTLFCSALIVWHCIISTDVVEIAKQVLVMFAEAYGD